MENNIGKLKRQLKDICPECDCRMELREKSDGGRLIEYKYCPACEYESKPLKFQNLKNPYRSGEFVAS